MESTDANCSWGHLRTMAGSMPVCRIYRHRSTCICSGELPRLCNYILDDRHWNAGHTTRTHGSCPQFGRPCSRPVGTGIVCTELYNNRALSHGLLRNSVTFYSQLDVASETSSLFLIAWLKMRNHYQDFLTRPTWIPWTSSPMPTESDKIQLNNEHSVVTVGFYTNEMFCCCLLITFSVSRRRRKMYCGHARLCVCLSVCLSVCVCPRPYAHITARTRM